MSTIARAFTTRRVKLSTDLATAAKDSPQRSNTTKGSSGPAVRPKISAPLELVHTTNMLSYNAPDIFPRKQQSSPLSSSSSTKSDDDDTDSGSSPNTAGSSPPTSPDVSPRERDERSMAPSPELNHLSCYFPPTKEVAARDSPVVAPKIPQRAPSHTKKASYEALARSRSNSALTSRLSNQSSKTVSTKASFTFSTGSRASSASTTASSISHQSVSYSSKPVVALTTPSAAAAAATQPAQKATEALPENHPFGQELAQVTEIAEEYGVTENMKVIDDEEKELAAKGLNKFSAEDYLAEVQSLINSFFADTPPPPRHPRPVAAIWI